MRTLLFISFYFFYFFSYSQDYLRTEVTIISPNRDTLWILNNDTGRLIAASWESPIEKEKKDKPVILIVNSFPYIDQYTEKNKSKGYIRSNK